MKKKKAKKAEKVHTLKLDCVQNPIVAPVATQFKFQHGLSVVAILLPSVGTVVIGSNGPKNPGTCWRYPAGTSMSDAVGMAFRQILEEACANLGTKK